LLNALMTVADADAGAREVALLAVAQLMQVFGLGSTVAAEAYVEAQQHALAEGDRVRRDLLEDLLARHAAVAGPKRSLLRLPGSARTRGCWSPRRPWWGSGPTTGSCGTPPWGGRFRGGGGYGLAVVRQDEIVGIVPLPQGGTEVAVANLRCACDDLQRRQVRLLIAMLIQHPPVPARIATGHAFMQNLGRSHYDIAIDEHDHCRLPKAFETSL
jgi:hypothetical protein